MSWTTAIPESDSSGALIAELVTVAARRKRLILLVLLGTILGAYVALAFMTEQYEAEARLLVKLGRENAEVPLTVDKGGVYSTGVAKEEINSNIQLLTSRSLIEATIDQLGVERFMFRSPRPPGFFKAVKYFTKQAFRYVKETGHHALVLLDLEKELGNREKAVNSLVGAVKAVRERDSNVTIVKIRLPDPILALDTMSALLNIYLQRHIQVQRGEGNLRQVFEQQSAELGKQLEELQGRMVLLKQEAKLSSAPEQRTQLLQRLDQLKREIDTRTSEHSKLQSEQVALQARLKALPASTKSQEILEANRGSLAIKERLIQLRLKRVEIAGRYSDDFPLAKNIDDEIASLEKLLSTEEATQTGDVTYQPNPVSVEFEAEVERANVKQVGLMASINEQRRQIADIEAELQRLDAGDDHLRLAELERRVLEEKFLATSTRSSAARIAEDLDQRQVANLAVLGTPSVPEEPVYPPKLLIMGIAIAAGLFLGFGLALALEWSSDVIHAPRDIIAVEGLPFLGQFRCRSASAPIQI